MNTQIKQTPGPLHNVTGYKPGPWIRQVLNDESEAYIHDKHCNAIARVYSLSDAALIAAAPALYEALQDTMRVLRSLRDDKEEWYTLVTPELLTAWDKNKAVLAQAEGHQHG